MISMFLHSLVDLAELRWRMTKDLAAARAFVLAGLAMLNRLDPFISQDSIDVTLSIESDGELLARITPRALQGLDVVHSEFGGVHFVVCPASGLVGFGPCRFTSELDLAKEIGRGHRRETLKAAGAPAPAPPPPLAFKYGDRVRLKAGEFCPGLVTGRAYFVTGSSRWGLDLGYEIGAASLAHSVSPRRLESVPS